MAEGFFKIALVVLAVIVALFAVISFVSQFLGPIGSALIGAGVMYLIALLFSRGQKSSGWRYINMLGAAIACYAGASVFQSYPTVLGAIGGAITTAVILGVALVIGVFMIPKDKG